jgi:DNA-binding NarL/FixJ family response regulator
VIEERISTLIIAPPGRFRDSLRVLLRAGKQISLIGQADEGTAGLKIIAEEKPRLVLLDADLPDEAAWGILDQLKKESENIRCLLLTHTPHQQAKAQQAGANAVLPDGFSTEILFENLQSLASEARG